jgi:octaprenyl-diphosphate synthase
MSINTKSLDSIKSLAANDLNSMDEVIKERLFTKTDLIKAIANHIITSGGKRLRPILVILSCKLFNYQGQRHINLAAVVEFIHTATLLHDDVVDHSYLRRGYPTANKNWDNKSSILVGDFLFSQAFMLIAEDGDLNILEILSKASAIIAEGEVKQLSSISNLHITLQEYLEIITAKTAQLFAASCQTGAIIADVNQEIALSMHEFGLNLGIAFQIIDDILDYQADQMVIGKNIGDDFKEGKVTLPIILAYDASNQEEKEFWVRTINKLDQQNGDFSHALEIINKYNIMEECLAMANHFASKAKDNIAIVSESDIKNLLIDILNFSVDRNL